MARLKSGNPRHLRLVRLNADENAHDDPAPGHDSGTGHDAAQRSALIDEVQLRLRRAVTDSHADEAEGGTRMALHRLHTTVLDCAEVIGGLSLAPSPETARLSELQRELDATRATLRELRTRQTALAAEERQARHLALHDPLTSLPNRRFFRERLIQALTQTAEKRSPFAVLYLDLDGFKPLNDAHGHPVGDELLKIIAGRLALTVRSNDMVSRLGGDEFGLLLLGLVDRVRLADLSDRLSVIVSAPVRIGRVRCEIRPSIGIAISPDHGTTPDALIKCADDAMYRAKRSNSGHAFAG